MDEPDRARSAALGCSSREPVLDLGGVKPQTADIEAVPVGMPNA